MDERTTEMITILSVLEFYLFKEVCSLPTLLYFYLYKYSKP